MRPAPNQNDSAEIATAGFFVLRTPYLPACTLATLADQIESGHGEPDADSLERDRARVHRFLVGLTARPDIAEALHIASPSLSAGLEAWREDPTTRSAMRVERALLSYSSRMSTRATPFGLFAGWSNGDVGPANTLQLGPRDAYRRHADLDCGYVNSLGEALQTDPSISEKLQYAPNPSIYEAGGRLRYVVARGSELDLVAIVPDDAVRQVLRCARHGATADMLIDAVREIEGDIAIDEAEEYVETLIEQQVVVSNLTRLVTGCNPLDILSQRLAGLAPQDIVDTLEHVRSLLRNLNSRPAGTGLGDVRSIAEALRNLPASVDPARLVRCDLKKPAHAELSTEVLAEIGHGVDLLTRIGGTHAEDPLRAFRTAFTRRYADEEVPLAEALDSECGVGFPDAAIGESVSAGAEPLLEGLRFPSLGASGGGTLFSGRDALLAKWLLAAAREGRQELRLGPDEIAELETVTPRAADRPTAIAAIATILAADPEAVANQNYRVLLMGATGPSGANLLGRFCGSDDSLTERVRGHLSFEEEQRPQAVFAEIVHLPEPRLGNVLTRPVLRQYEIPYLGQSDAPSSNHIPISDLRVSVRAGQVVLRSVRLDREVVPRLTAAHNFASRGNVPLYRFLCSLQHQNVTPYMSFSFGALRDTPFLPRVTAGRFILSRARWTVSAAELAPLCNSEGLARFQAMQALRRALGMPRCVAVADNDKLLAVDLANVVFVDVVASRARGRSQITFVELFLRPDELLAAGPEGAYTHELVLPLHVGAPAPVASEEMQRRKTLGPTLVRRLTPGSEWLFLKLYSGAASVDTVLQSIVRPSLAETLAANTVHQWFFVRYSDPGWHLRLRLQGDGKRLLRDVLPAFIASCQAHLDSGLISRIQVDTYVREIERYGGAAGLLLAERVFWADSEAALGVVERLDRDEVVDHRWLFALVGADQLLADLGLDMAQRHAVVAAARARFALRFKVDAPLRRKLDERYRAERAGLERAMLDPAGPRAAFIERSMALRSVPTVLAETIDSELLHSWAASVVHMQINRILRWATNRQEFVIYDLLARHYESVLARESGIPGHQISSDAAVISRSQV